MGFSYRIIAAAMAIGLSIFILLPVKSYEYDVFLNFRGVDTRFGFGDGLYNALIRSGVRTFKDNSEIFVGEDFQLAIEAAIHKSRMMLAVFSQNYASSTWPLDELAIAMKLARTSGLIVVPIFYYVDPSDVGKINGTYGEAIAEHESRFQQDMEKWKAKLLRRTSFPSDMRGKIQELMAEIEKPFKETVDGWNQAWKEMVNIRRTGTSDIKEKLENYDVWMAGKEKQFSERKKAACKGIADLARIVAFDTDEMTYEFEELLDEIEGYDKERIEGWTASLQEVVFHRGFVVDYMYEGSAIKEIVKLIVKYIMVKGEGGNILAKIWKTAGRMLYI